MSLVLSRRSFPDRVAELGFAVDLPQDWISHPLPEEMPDFDDPTQLVPLAIVTATQAAIVWSIAARPVYPDSSLILCAQYLMGAQQDLQLQAMSAGELGGLPAMVGQAEQTSDRGPMTVYFAFAEDGERLVMTSLMVPAMFASSLWPARRGVLDSFRLATPKGPTIPLMPGSTVTANSAVAQGDSPAEPTPDTDEEPAADEGAATPPPQKASRLGRDASRAWRRALDLEASGQLEAAEQLIRESHPDNEGLLKVAAMYRLRFVRLHDEGKVAAARAAHQQAVKWARLFAGNGEDAELVEARDNFLKLLGPASAREAAAAANREGPPWWREALALEESGQLEAAEKAILGGFPDKRALLKIADMYWMRGNRLRDAGDEAGACEAQGKVLGWANQYADAATSVAEAESLLHTRDEFLRSRGLASSPQAEAPKAPLAPSSPRTAREHRHAAALAEAEARANGPQWWHRALELEAAGQLATAERTIKDGVSNNYAAMQIAEMYRLRLDRLFKAGDMAGAREAHRSAVDWAGAFAAGATSGGEGTAFSRERDDLVKSLGAEPRG